MLHSNLKIYEISKSWDISHKLFQDFDELWISYSRTRPSINFLILKLISYKISIIDKYIHKTYEIDFQL